jgi:hypothetical protein
MHALLLVRQAIARGWIGVGDADADADGVSVGQTKQTTTNHTNVNRQSSSWRAVVVTRPESTTTTPRLGSTTAVGNNHTTIVVKRASHGKTKKNTPPEQELQKQDQQAQQPHAAQEQDQNSDNDNTNDNDDKYKYSHRLDHNKVVMETRKELVRMYWQQTQKDYNYNPPLICMNQTLHDRLLEATRMFEQHMINEGYLLNHTMNNMNLNTPTLVDEAELRQHFNEAIEKQKFCDLDMTAVLWEGNTNTNNEREHDSRGLLKRGGMTHWKAFFTFLNSLDSMAWMVMT